MEAALREMLNHLQVRNGIDQEYNTILRQTVEAKRVELAKSSTHTNPLVLFLNMINALSFLLFIGFCTFLLYGKVLSNRQHRKARSRGYHSPRTYPHKGHFGIGLFLNTGKAIQENRYLSELIRRYTLLGNTFGAKFLGSSSIHSIEPENIKAVFSTNAKDWGVQPVRLPAQDPFCGRGFITTDGAAWEHSRSLLQPSFQKGNAVDLPTVERYLKTVIDRIPGDGETFDLQPLLFSLYLDTATLFLFGESINSLSNETSQEAQTFLKAFDHAMQGSGIRIALGPVKILYPYFNSGWLKSCKRTHQFADKCVAKALRDRHLSSARPYTLLSGMASQTDDKLTLRNEILQALMAAQETTAALISNVFFLLSRHPSVWNRLRDEVSSAPDPRLDEKSVLNMYYLRNILNETLRLYPVFPQMNRVALSDTTLPVGGGMREPDPIFVPKGTGFDTSWYNLHRLPSIWVEGANEFRPERRDDFKPSTWQFMAFGGGPRGCLGRTKALTEASYIVVRLVREFDGIESRDEQEWRGKVQLTMKNVHGLTAPPNTNTQMPSHFNNIIITKSHPNPTSPAPSTNPVTIPALSLFDFSHKALTLMLY
ncbi:MAG: hypothetical protein Q9183_003754, partial [Haloplaca sp. 2 TL-2023]